MGGGPTGSDRTQKKKPSVDRTEGSSEAEIDRSGDDLGVTRAKQGRDGNGEARNYQGCEKSAARPVGICSAAGAPKP